MAVTRPFLTAFLLSVLCIFDLAPGIASASAQFACTADITGDHVVGAAEFISWLGDADASTAANACITISELLRSMGGES